MSSKNSFDVCVVGGGIIGLSIAREVTRRGLTVSLIERGRFGGESSHAAAGMLAPQAEANRDDDFFRLACASRDLFKRFAADLKTESGVDVEHDGTSGILYLAFDQPDEREILKRYDWQTKAGFKLELLSGDEVRRLEPHVSPHARQALLFPNDGQIENRRLTVALLAGLQQSGARLLANCEVTGWQIEGRRIINAVTRDAGAITAATFVLANGAWASRLMNITANHQPTLETVEPIRGQMLAFDNAPSIINRIIYTPRGYVVPRRDGRLLAGATVERAGFNKQVTGYGLHTVTNIALEIAPSIANLNLVDAWAGLRPCAPDKLPIVGAATDIENLIYATAHYRNGILFAPLTAHAVADWLTRTPMLDDNLHQRLAAFSPARFA